jgi:ribosome-associated translation inhibitor RaiA
MQIEVISEDKAITAEVRAYAEYRLFAILARYAGFVRSTRVIFRRSGRDGTGGRIVCAVTVALEPSGYARARASNSLVYRAIDRATERVGELMSRRVEPRSPT